MTESYIGMGSNLCQPFQQLENAYRAIAALPQTRIIHCSSVYQSRAMTLDNEVQDDYLNAVLQVETELDAEALLDALFEIENQQGRSREKRWAARTIDLDIILYGDESIQSPRLTVPHAEMRKRNFVLTPLYQLSPQLMIRQSTDCAEKTPLRELLAAVSDQPLKVVGELHG